MNLACRLSCFLPRYPCHAQQILW